MVELEAQEGARDLLRGIEAQREVPHQIVLGCRKLGLCWAFGCVALYLVQHDLDGRPGVRGVDRCGGHEGTRMLVRDKTRPDGIRQSAILADSLVKARGERPAAEDLVRNVGGDEVGVASLKAGSADPDDGLRN